jgi:hypothetical protein
MIDRAGDSSAAKISRTPPAGRRARIQAPRADCQLRRNELWSLWKLAEGVSLQVRCLRGDE